MEETSFFYWLQGYFELTEGQRPLSMKQVTCIRRHLDLVDEKGDRLKQLSTLFEFAADGLADLGPLTERVRAVLADQFLHVIDPKSGGPEVQAKLNATHMGQVGPGGVVFRC